MSKQSGDNPYHQYTPVVGRHESKRWVPQTTSYDGDGWGDEYETQDQVNEVQDSQQHKPQQLPTMSENEEPETESNTQEQELKSSHDGAAQENLDAIRGHDVSNKMINSGYVDHPVDEYPAGLHSRKKSNTSRHSRSHSHSGSISDQHSINSEDLQMEQHSLGGGSMGEASMDPNSEYRDIYGYYSEDQPQHPYSQLGLNFAAANSSENSLSPVEERDDSDESESADVKATTDKMLKVELQDGNQVSLNDSAKSATSEIMSKQDRELALLYKHTTEFLDEQASVDPLSADYPDQESKNSGDHEGPDPAAGEDESDASDGSADKERHHIQDGDSEPAAFVENAHSDDDGGDLNVQRSRAFSNASHSTALSEPADNSHLSFSSLNAPISFDDHDLELRDPSSLARNATESSHPESTIASSRVFSTSTNTDMSLNSKVKRLPKVDLNAVMKANTSEVRLEQLHNLRCRESEYTTGLELWLETSLRAAESRNAIFTMGTPPTAKERTVPAARQVSSAITGHKTKEAMAHLGEKSQAKAKSLFAKGKKLMRSGE